MWREKNPVGGVVLGKNASACGKKIQLKKQKFEPISKLVNSHGRWGTTEQKLRSLLLRSQSYQRFCVMSGAYSHTC